MRKKILKLLREPNRLKPAIQWGIRLISARRGTVMAATEETPSTSVKKTPGRVRPWELIESGPQIIIRSASEHTKISEVELFRCLIPDLGGYPLIFTFEGSAPFSELLVKLKVECLDDAGQPLPLVNDKPLVVYVGFAARRVTVHLPVPAGCAEARVSVLPTRPFAGDINLTNVRLINRARETAVIGGVTNWKDMDLSRHWYQTGSRLHVRSVYGDHWIEMPDGWSMEGMHPATWRIVEEYIFGRMENMLFGIERLDVQELNPSEARPRGASLLLAFSGGAGCTAAMEVLPPETIKYHSWRDDSPFHLANGKSYAHPSRKFLRRNLEAYGDVLFVPQTLDLVPIGMGLTIGLKDPIGYVVYAVLLSHHLDVGTVALGSVMEQCFLMSGIRYSDVAAIPHSTMNRAKHLLAHAGLAYTQPVSGCSEVITSKIVHRSKHRDLVLSCGLIDQDGHECGVCFKCFRKERLFRSDVPEPSDQVKYILHKRPLKSATSVMYACKSAGWSNPDVEEYLDVRLDYLDRYYGYAVDTLVPQEFQEHVHRRFKELGFESMNREDELRLKQVAQVFWPEAWEVERTGLREDELLPLGELFDNAR